MMCLRLLLLAQALYCWTPAVASSTTSQGKAIEQLFDKYQTDVRPEIAMAERGYGEDSSCDGLWIPPDQVRTQFEVTRAVLDERKEEYDLRGYFRIWWLDRRLAYQDLNESSCSGWSHIDILSEKQRLWKPSIYFDNMVEVDIDGNTEDHGEQLFLYPKGEIFWSRQGHVRLRCKMGFGRMPFDDQSCLILIGIYSETSSNVHLVWEILQQPLGTFNWDQVEDHIHAGKWQLQAIKATDIITAFPSGNYSYAKACVKFKRTADQDISYVWLACLFVIMSYLGFFINPAAAPARVCLGVLMVLIVINHNNAVQIKLLPDVAYPVWLLDFQTGCAIFGAVAFASYALTNYGLKVDAELEAMRISAVLHKVDLNDNGILDWWEMREAQIVISHSKELVHQKHVEKLKESHYRTSDELAPGAPGNDNSDQHPDRKASHRKSVSAHTMQGVHLDMHAFDMHDLEGELKHNILFAGGKMARSSHLGKLTDAVTSLSHTRLAQWVPSLQPEAVRHWKDLDRHMRCYFLLAFFLYVAIMLATVHTYDPNVAPSDEAHRCE